MKSVERNIVVESILLIVILPILAVFFIFGILYFVKLKQEKAFLHEMAKSSAALVETIGKFNALFNNAGRTDKNLARTLTISAIRETQRYDHGFGNTGEIMLTERHGDEIVFLLQSRKDRFSLPPLLKYSGNDDLAVPVRLALSGKSGTIIAKDYRGHRVLAAYEYLPFLDMGLVVKVDMAELMAPCIKAGVSTVVLLIILLVSGIFIYIRTVQPLIEKVMKSEQDEQELLHILSHDLNNSLAVTRLALDMAETGHDLEKFRKQMDIAVNNGIEIISIVRAMRKADAKGLVMSSVNLGVALDESYHILENKFKEKNIKLNTDVPEDLAVNADRTALVNSILNNLFTNAIKFSYKNDVITVRGYSKGSKVILSVSDNGMGMPANVLDHLFHIGASTSRHGTEGEKGTGFGMSLVKKFVELFGGTIEVSSKPEQDYPEDHGTEFIITFLKDVSNESE